MPPMDRRRRRLDRVGRAADRSIGVIALALGVAGIVTVVGFSAPEGSAVHRWVHQLERSMTPEPPAARAWSARARALRSGDLDTLVRMTRDQPADPMLWLQRGLVELRSGKHARSVGSFEQAEAHAWTRRQVAIARYNVACAHALDGACEPALAALESAIEAGYNDHEHTLGDPDLASLRGDPRFEALVERMQRERAGIP
jgi:hypothetical protein